MISIEAIKGDNEPARYRATDKKFIHPSSLVLVNRQLLEDIQGLLLRYAPVLAFRVENCEFGDVLTWIDDLPEKAFQSLIVPQDQHATVSWQKSPPNPTQRELLIELALPSRPSTSQKHRLNYTQATALSRWLLRFVDPSSRVAQLNIRYTIVERHSKGNGDGDLTSYLMARCSFYRQIIRSSFYRQVKEERMWIDGEKLDRLSEDFDDEMAGRKTFFGVGGDCGGSKEGWRVGDEGGWEVRGLLMPGVWVYSGCVWRLV